MINKIYLIDDDETFIFITKKTIEKVDLLEKLEIFPNGLEALNHLKSIAKDKSKLPNFIILDLSMPIMDGWQFLDEFEKLKIQFEKQITIFICSSSISPDDILKAKNYENVVDYIIKPITKDKILEIVEAIESD